MMMMVGCKIAVKATIQPLKLSEFFNNTSKMYWQIEGSDGVGVKQNQVGLIDLNYEESKCTTQLR